MDERKIEFQHKIRELEFINSIDKFPLTKNEKEIEVLEIGSGSGFQLMLLKKKFKKAVGIEIEQSGYRNHRISDLIIYDGEHIPFQDNSFDLVFSSNTLEHIKSLDNIYKEIKRILKTDGVCIHIMPTHTWRFWTFLVHPIINPFRVLNKILIHRVLNKDNERFYNENSKVKHKSLSRSDVKKTKSFLFKSLNLFKTIFFSFILERHGERGNRITEFYYFTPKWWEANFIHNDWNIIESFPTGIFYSGHHLFGSKLSLHLRKKLSYYLGSSCHTFILNTK